MERNIYEFFTLYAGKFVLFCSVKFVISLLASLAGDKIITNFIK